MKFRFHTWKRQVIKVTQNVITFGKANTHCHSRLRAGIQQTSTKAQCRHFTGFRVKPGMTGMYCCA